MSSTQMERLEHLIRPSIEVHACDLWGIQLINSGNRRILRVYIDKPEGISLTDCEKVSRQIAFLLDVEDPIKGSYLLEVSSPGLDRQLFNIQQYEQSVGEKVYIVLHATFEGRRCFKGVLWKVNVFEKEICLLCDEHEFTFPIEMVEKANVVPCM